MARAQAFGIAPDMTAVEAGAFARIKDRLLLVPPQPNDRFVAYIGRVGPGGQICEVSATTAPHRYDPQGHAVREEYDKVRAHLDGIYGAGTRDERVSAGSPWTAEHDWVLSVLMGARSHRSAWSAPLPAGLERIDLTVDAVGVGRSRVKLTYVFDIAYSCGEIESISASGL